MKAGPNEGEGAAHLHELSWPLKDKYSHFFFIFSSYGANLDLKFDTNIKLLHLLLAEI